MTYILDYGIVCSLGSSKSSVAHSLLRRDNPIPDQASLFSEEAGRMVCRVHSGSHELPPNLMKYACRNNYLAISIISQIKDMVARQITERGASRVGVILGTSTSGIDETQKYLKESRAGEKCDDYHAVMATLGGLSEFIAEYLEVQGPVFTISTACTSSANAILTAHRLIQADVCDLVLTGGIDTLCQLTIKGFASLDALSKGVSKPFSDNRDGINIGEGGAIFLLGKEESNLQLLGGGASSDAYHMSAPDPEAKGAIAAMKSALSDSGISAEQVDYINLHGTGTIHNDAMESLAIAETFGLSKACSTTKVFTGHTLGAASAVELAICCLLMSQDEGVWRYPPMPPVDNLDQSLPAIALPSVNDFAETRPKICMSNSFAFGGSNSSLVLARV